MYENNKDLGKEKWEIYMNVVRKIYSEVGGLKECDMGLRDINRYINLLFFKEYMIKNIIYLRYMKLRL